MRRIFWSLVGIGIGVVVGAAVVRWSHQTKQRYAPPALAREAGSKLDQLRSRLVDAIAVGAGEMERREDELRHELGLPLR